MLWRFGVLAIALVVPAACLVALRYWTREVTDIRPCAADAAIQSSKLSAKITSICVTRYSVAVPMP